LAHLRAGQLQAHAGMAEGLETVRLYNAAAARLLAEFRKTALALKCYRGAPGRGERTETPPPQPGPSAPPHSLVGWLGRKGRDVSDKLKDKPKSPRRVEGGRRNRSRRGPLTPGGRERLRQSALRNRPWEHSTGPRTPSGKAQSARNGKSRQKGPLSLREVRAALKGVGELVRHMREAREQLS